MSIGNDDSIRGTFYDIGWDILVDSKLQDSEATLAAGILRRRPPLPSSYLKALEILDEARILPAEVSVRDCLGTHCGEKNAALSPRIGYSKVKMGLHQVQRRLEADDNCSTKYNAPWRFERGETLRVSVTAKSDRSAGLEAKSTPARIEA
uniref:Uncharacterized protein n=1 Tax=Coccidioides posadasii RMSCC 3488 TaxID=454284 RepID=A0A0J6FJG2_COCPO|nr:hypothetical protein CPAG_09595 [Coccidioides posadasii RMSCC 3488]